MEEQFRALDRDERYILAKVSQTTSRTTGVRYEIYLAWLAVRVYRAFHLARGIYPAPRSVTQYSGTSPV